MDPRPPHAFGVLGGDDTGVCGGIVESDDATTCV